MGRERKTLPGWPGYLHRQGDGQWLFIIEKQIEGTRYHVSTRCHSLKAAREQLERFEAHPSAYDARGLDGERLVLTDELIEEWEAFSVAKGNSGRYTRDHGRKLADWILRLNGADLRRLGLRQLREALRGLSAQKHRIIAIKAFFAWLRTEKGLLSSAQDATLELKVPQSSPEKHRRRKVVPWEHVAAVLAHLDETAAADAWRPRGQVDKLEPGIDAKRRRDCLLLLTATGWHVTELERFVRGGEIRQGGGEVLGVLVVRHKGGDLARTPVTHREHFEAAERLRAAGEVPRNLQREHLEACRLANVPPFGLGVMRHSVATWAVEAGAAPEAVARFLGHKDKRTTERFYVDVAVPTNVIPLRRVT